MAIAIALSMSCAGAGAPDAFGPAAGLGPEDRGAQLVLFYGSELLGSLDGCECMGNPRLGGLPYRVSFTAGMRAAWAGAASLDLDAGASMAPTATPDGRPLPESGTQNLLMRAALATAGIDAVNLTVQDADALERLYRRDGFDLSETALFVSANIEPTGPEHVAPQPYLVREISGSRLEGGRLRVAVAGVTRPDTIGPVTPAFHVTDPAAALLRVLPRAQAESDLVVVLAYLTAVEGERLAEKLEGLADVVIVASSISGDREPRLDSAVRVVYAWYKTQNLGVMALRLDGGRVAGATAHYVKLDEPIPRDPVMTRMADEADAEIRSERERRFQSK